jgi:hypothetical protein
LRSLWPQFKKRWCCLCFCWAVAACWCDACLLGRCRRTTCLKCLSNALGFLGRLPDAGRMYTCSCIDWHRQCGVTHAQVQDAAAHVHAGRDSCWRGTAAVCALLGQYNSTISVYRARSAILTGL